MNSPNKNWQKIVSNARACLSSERVYCYTDPEKKTGIVFNILGDMLRLLPDQTSELQSGQEEAHIHTLNLFIFASISITITILLIMIHHFE